MRHVLWPAVSLALLSATVPAAQGVHPGPLPAPLGQESDRLPAPPDAGPGAPEAYGGAPGYSFAPPGQDYGYGDRGYPPPSQPGSRGHWQWVPAEPTGPDSYGRGPSGAPYPGRGDSYGYPPPGYGASSPDAYADPYRGRAAPPSYGGYAEPYPDYGSAGGYPPDAYAPPPGYYPQPPRATVKP